MPDPLIDGFNDQSAGMDSSRTPEALAETTFALGVNVVARDGMLRTRSIYKRVELAAPAYIRTGFHQGSESYYNPASGAKRIIGVWDGRIYAIDPFSARFTDLSADGLVNDGTAPHYLCQVADSFLVISNGKDRALIYDGSKLRRATEDEVPVGTLMAFGQGRLFLVSPDFRSVAAGDLIYGGSTAAAKILLSTPGASAKITTTTPHGYATGDTVSITRHYSSPAIIGTWSITVTSPTTFTIPAPLTTGSSGGLAYRANDGVESDALRFTEMKFLNEKGIFRLPAKFGPIVMLTFFALQDTGTGQGDLMLGGPSGAVTLNVSLPRERWLDTQIEREAIVEKGMAGPRCFAQVNGDIFFASPDSQIRSYRNARAEFGQYTNTPVSAEMLRVLHPSTRTLLGNGSMALFDNRLLYTSTPTLLASTDAAVPPRVIYQSLVSLDFHRSSRMSKTSGLAAYDGIWTGLDLLQLIRCNYGVEEKLFAIAYQKNNDGSRNNELWEITTEDTGADLYTVCETGVVHRTPIKSAVEFRAMTFNSGMLEKRLTRMDAWLQEIGGTAATFSAFWRPDLHGGGWFPWTVSPIAITRDDCAYTDAGGAGGCDIPRIRPLFHVSPLRIGTPPVYEDKLTKRFADRGFSFQVRVEWEGKVQLTKAMVYAETPPAPSQGDATARQLTDATSATRVLEYPVQVPPGKFVALPPTPYIVTPIPTCEAIPCFDLYLAATTPRPEFVVILEGFESGPVGIQFAAGKHVLARNPSDGHYLLDFANGFVTARLEAVVSTPTMFLSVTPDITDPDTAWFNDHIPVDTCIQQPLEILLDSNWIRVLP